MHLWFEIKLPRVLRNCKEVSATSDEAMDEPDLASVSGVSDANVLTTKTSIEQWSFPHHNHLSFLLLSTSAAFMWAPKNKDKNSPQTGVLRRTFKTSFTGSSSSKSATSERSYSSSDGEQPLAILKIQVISCTNLPSADLNGKSDP